MTLAPDFAVELATLIWPDGRFPTDAEAAASVRVMNLLSQSRKPGVLQRRPVIELLRDMAASLHLARVEIADVQAVMTVTALLMRHEGITVNDALMDPLYDLLKGMADSLEGGAS